MAPLEALGGILDSMSALLQNVLPLQLLLLLPLFLLLLKSPDSSTALDELKVDGPCFSVFFLDRET